MAYTKELKSYLCGPPKKRDWEYSLIHDIYRYFNKYFKCKYSFFLNLISMNNLNLANLC